MKTVKLSIAVVAIGSIMAFSSCTKNDVSPAKTTPPTTSSYKAGLETLQDSTKLSGPRDSTNSSGPQDPPVIK